MNAWIGARAAMLRGAGARARGAALPAVALGGLAAALVAWAVTGTTGTAQAILLGALLLSGTPVVARTLYGMLRGRFAADIVASLAIAGALVTGEYLAGCVIVLMQTGGEVLDAYAVGRASAALATLLERAPRVAHRYACDELEEVPVTAVAAGDRLLVRPGDIVPVDGVVITGRAAIDQSALTGEPLPLGAGPGIELMSGSVDLDGALELRALRPSGESQYEQIVRLVSTAQREKAPIGRLADHYAILFTPVTLAMCGLAYALTRRPEAVVAVLVVATPCPLILATPIAIISGVNRAARHGIIVKTGAALEALGKTTAVAFDKTGTLTTGRPTVQRIVALDDFPDHDTLRLAAGLEQFSDHHMARALVAAGREHFPDLPVPSDVQESAGLGVRGRVEGHQVEVGSVTYAAMQGIAAVEVLTAARRHAGVDGDALAVVSIDGRPAALVVYADALRPTVPALLRRLEAAGVRETVMLTGDDEATARAVAAEAGIAQVRADLLPPQKVEAVRELRARHGAVVMVGDGINDAPALAAATVGVALGARGTAISAEAADVVITVDDLGRVADAVEIGERTLRIALQSIWVGLGVSGVLMGVAAFGFIPPALGAVLQEGLDVAVIVNALRARLDIHEPI